MKPCQLVGVDQGAGHRSHSVGGWYICSTDFSEYHAIEEFCNRAFALVFEMMAKEWVPCL